MSDIAEDIRSAMTETEALAPAVEQPEVSQETFEAPTAPDRQSTTGGRDASGRFAPQTPSQTNDQIPTDGQPAAQKVTSEGDLQAVQNTQTQAPAKAPISWRPEAREEWAKTPPAIQQEVMRREREITDTLRTTAEARHFSQQFNQVVQPYAHMIQAENATPIQAFQNLMQTAAALRTGSAQQKAQLVSEIISQHNIDVEQLDNLLSAKFSGKQAAAPQNDMMALLDQRLAPFQQYMHTQQQTQQRAQQQEMAQLQQETASFLNDPKNEFANDLAGDIADILELGANRGQKISLQDAYNRATMLHPTISDIIQRRKTGQSAANESEAAIRARRAAASITNSGAPSRDSGTDDGDDIRSALAASMRSLTRR